MHKQTNVPAGRLPEEIRRLATDKPGAVSIHVGNWPIHYATMYQNTEVLKILLDERVDVNYSNDLGLTPLAVACAVGWKDGVDILLAAKADRNKADIQRRSPLDHAKPFPEIRRVLLRNRFGLAANDEPPPNIRLFLAVDQDEPTELRELLKDPAARTFTDASGVDAVMFAVGWDRPKSLAALQEAGCNLNRVAPAGFSALILAINQRKEPMAQQLLAWGADPNSGDPRTTATPLQTALAQKLIPLANQLLDRGANPAGAQPAAVFSAPPLCYAANQGELALVKRLIDAGANVKALDSEGYGVLMHACMADNPATIYLLIEKGLDPNEVFHDGQTPLSMAVRKRQVEAVRALLNRGAQPDPLMHAIRPDRWVAEEVTKEIMQLLDRKHGDAYAAQKFWASRPDRQQIMDFIKGGGSAQTADMASPLQQAIESGDFELARFLLKAGARAAGEGTSYSSPLTMLGHNQAGKSDAELVALARELVTFGADPNFPGQITMHNHHWTPLESAVRKGSVGLVEYLLQIGAKPSSASKMFAEVENDLAPEVAERIRQLLKSAEGRLPYKV